MKLLSLAEHSRRNPWLAWGGALLFPVLSLAIRVALGSTLVGFPFLTFFLAVLLAAYFGGRGPGFLSVLIAAALAAYQFAEPIGSFRVVRENDYLAIGLFALIASTGVLLLEATFSAYDRIKLVEEALAEREVELTAAMDASQVAIVDFDHRSGRFNRSARLNQIYGYAPDVELTIDHVRARYHPDMRHQIPAMRERDELETDKDRFDWTLKLLLEDGSTKWVRGLGEYLRDDEGRLARSRGVVMDISAEVIANEKLSTNSKQLETLNRTGAAIAAELDLEHIVQLVTDAGVELTGAAFGAFFYNRVDRSGESLTLYTLSGAPRSEFDHFGHPRATPVFAPTFKGEGVVRSGDITLDERYGKFAPHFGLPKGHLPVRSYLAVPVKSRSGETFGGLFFGHPEIDIFTPEHEAVVVGMAGQAAIAIDNARLFEATQRTNVELERRVEERTRELEAASEALRQAQKMEAIGRLTGGIAHDFNNLLTVIRGSADLLRSVALPEERRKRYVEAIAQTADRASSLTAQLLAFARRQALQPEVFDVVERLNNILEMLRSMLGSKIVIQLVPDCPECFVRADPTQFETSVVNLASNAADAMDGEGRIVLTAARSSMAGGQDCVIVSVADSGHGIPPDKLDNIFEPFFTTKPVGKGTGLGLSQVYGFAKQSGGEIKASSEIGRGTTFELRLPLEPSPPTVHNLPKSTGLDSVASGCVLVVEDNAAVRSFASSLLCDLGFDVLEARGPIEALDLLQQRAADVDVIFTDVVMPEMTGIELAITVRKKWTHIPVVLTSGYSEVIVDRGQHGFPLLQKPYSADQLKAVLLEALAAQAMLPGPSG
jgi:signal transduction histidine kinase/CheY-like chemotaxis protein/PAS domain-containing protein